jgi:transcriptional regulator with XRE-family HTH domain
MAERRNPRDESFGEWLQRQLDRREISQRLFARHVGVTSAAVSRWIRNMDVPSGVNPGRIAAALGLDAAIVMHRIAGAPHDPGFLAALEEQATPEEQQEIRDFAAFVLSRRQAAPR